MRGARGFTLIEMMIAVLITAILVTGAVQAFREIATYQERALGSLQRDRYVEVFLDRFERELAGTLLIVKPDGEDRLGHPYLFVGDDRFNAETDVDAVRFVTQSPARAATDAAEGGVRMVSYAIVNSDDGAFTLVREEEPLPSGLRKEIQLRAGLHVFDDLARFQLRYLDEKTGEWRDAWDSTDLGQLDALPSEVEVTLGLLEQDAAGEWMPGIEHSRRVALPVRPLDLAAMRARAFGNGKGEQCLTTSECLSRFEGLLERASGPTLRAVQDALESGDACWDGQSQLAARIRSLGGDPDAECKP